MMLPVGIRWEYSKEISEREHKKYFRAFDTGQQLIFTQTAIKKKLLMWKAMKR